MAIMKFISRAQLDQIKKHGYTWEARKVDNLECHACGKLGIAGTLFVNAPGKEKRTDDYEDDGQGYPGFLNLGPECYRAITLLTR